MANVAIHQSVIIYCMDSCIIYVTFLLSDEKCTFVICCCDDCEHFTLLGQSVDRYFNVMNYGWCVLILLYSHWMMMIFLSVLLL